MDRVDAILALLEDRDPRVVDPLLSRLAADESLLDRTWQAALERGHDAPLALVHLVLRQDAEALVDAFAEAEDLETGVWLLPRLLKPRCDHRGPGAMALDEVAVRLRLDGISDGGALASWLCGACGFAGDHSDFDNPLNTYLTTVLERRMGMPIALTTLWILLGRRLGLSLDAIAIPGHVVGRWSGGYVDLFESGRDITVDELDERVRGFGGRAAPFLAPASDRALLRRMARNLTHSYLRREDAVRATIAHGLATG